MKKQYTYFSKKKLLKYLIIVLSLLLSGILFIFFYQNNPTVKSRPDPSEEIKRLTDIADVYFDTNKQDSALYVYAKVKALCNPKINSTDYVYALSCIAEIQQDQSDYIASEASATEALPYLKEIKNPRYSWIVYNLLGINYTHTFDNKNAILYFKKAIKLKTSTWRKSLGINNLVVVYMEQRKYKEAAILLNILASQKKISSYDAANNNDHAYIIDNLGFCYYKLGDSKKALDCYYEGLKIRLQYKNNDGLSTSLKHLSLFFQKTNPKLAQEYAQKAYNNASEINNIGEKISSLALLVKTSHGSDLKKYSLKYIQLTDNLLIAQKKTKNQFSNIKYTFNKDKAENLQLKALSTENKIQLERQKNRIIISYLIIVFVLGLILFLYFHLISKGKKEKNDAIFSSEIRISKKLHDELANDVYQTIAFAETKDLEKEDNKEKLLNNLDTIYFRTRNISKENSNISTDKNYPLAVKEMISGYKSPEINILINGFDTIRWNEIEKNKKIILYRILQELFVNMKKHSEASLASISFSIKNKNLHVIYIDNGVGIKNNTLILKNGLQNVESRIKTINGTIIFGNNSQKGFKISFTFPL
jgi:nitrate/nitrite-specific signal transduction histidine kinase